MQLTKLAALGLSSLVLAGCNTANVKSQFSELGNKISETASNLHESIDYQALFTVAGAVIGVALCDDKKELCAIAGAVVGNLAGAAVEERKKRLQALKEEGAVNFEFASTKTLNNKNGAADNATVVAVKEPNAFASGQAKPTSDGAKKYRALSKVYVDSPQSILVIGHSDASGSAELNQKLSESRAREIAKIFVEEGVPSERIFYQGAGESRPIASNDTKEGRQQNRRVEVVEVDSTSSLIAYDMAENSSQQYLAHSTKTASEQKKVERSVKAVDPADKSDFETLIKAKSNSSAKIDFGGSLARNDIDQIYPLIGEPEQRSGGWSLFNKAHASDDPRPLVSCYLDNPRKAGEIKSLEGKSLKDGTEYSSSDYLPQMNRSSWTARVNGHLVGLAPIAVLRDTGTPAAEPKMLIYKDFDGSSENVQPTYTLSNTATNTYSGTDGVLIRTFFLDANAPVSCMDVVVAKSQKMKGNSLGGALYYGAGDSLMMAEYKPAVLRKN